MLSKNIVFAFIVFEFLKNLKTDSRLQIFRAMRRSTSVAEILDSFSDDLKEFRESDHRQLFYRFEKDAVLDRSSLLSEQLIIKNSFEN